MTVSFDRVANIYDSTRWSGVPPAIMERMLNAMKDAFKDCKLILDIGTGTGRFAQYFNDSGFTIIGVDVSLPMMLQARQRGVRDLVRADAHHLPFRDQTFDASMMIHLIHLARDWVQAIHEAGRVTRKVLVSEAGDATGFSARQRYLEIRTEMGYPLNRLNDGEFGLRKLAPPMFVVSAGDYWTDVKADEEITSFDKRKSSVSWDLPEAVHRIIIQRIFTEYQGKTVRRHDIVDVVGWKPSQLRTFSVTGSIYTPE
jgi:SAM-dependent methyltransferase